MAADYVIDRNGDVWLLVHDGGMAMRANEASKTGVTSAGIAWLESTAGPLIEFDPADYRRTQTSPPAATGGAAPNRDH
jgi:hypothetical protein